MENEKVVYVVFWDRLAVKVFHRKVDAQQYLSRQVNQFDGFWRIEKEPS